MIWEIADFQALRERTTAVMKLQPWWPGVSSYHFHYRAARECWEVEVYLQNGREMEFLVDPTMNTPTLAALVSNQYALYSAHWTEEDT